MRRQANNRSQHGSVAGDVSAYASLANTDWPRQVSRNVAARCRWPAVCGVHTLSVYGKGVDMDTDTSELSAYKFIQQMVLRADGTLDFGASPFWHGWALREAFLAGVQWRVSHMQGEDDT